MRIDDVMDLILDQEGVEVDPIDRFEKDTPLHKAVRFVNARPKQDWEGAKALVDLLIDAGADPRCEQSNRSDTEYHLYPQSLTFKHILLIRPCYLLESEIKPS